LQRIVGSFNIAALGRALDGPAIVDAVGVADEMPNLPHVEFEQVGHFAMAKNQRGGAAVTGG
jgi:pyruvate dehydrogenase (quinone)